MTKSMKMLMRRELEADLRHIDATLQSFDEKLVAIIARAKAIRQKLNPSDEIGIEELRPTLLRILHKHHVTCWSTLEDWSANQLRRLVGIGYVSIQEIRFKMEARGLTLRGEKLRANSEPA